MFCVRQIIKPVEYLFIIQNIYTRKRNTLVPQVSSETVIRLHKETTGAEIKDSSRTKFST